MLTERRAAAMSSVTITKARREQAPIGLEQLESKEIDAIAATGNVPQEILSKIYGLNCPVVHPNFRNAEESKINQRGNPNSFAGLGWKKRKKTDEGGFESSITRGDDVPFVGLKNLGATCYMNCMLQCLFHNPQFRSAMFACAKQFAHDGSSNEDYAPIFELQRLFAHLKLSKEKAYDPAPFARSLKIESTAVQQDAQEFLKLLLTYLETRLAALPPSCPPRLRNLVQDQFGGKYAYCTRCLHCQRVSQVQVSFYDLDLKVAGLSRLEDCLDDFFRAETLQGDNQYACDACRLKRDAERGIRLLEVPRVLHLQLMRFVFDMKSGSRKKVSQQVSFPVTLDLARYLSPSASESAGSTAKAGKKPRRSVAAADASRAGGLVYDLQAVVLHSGPRASEGHYVSHIKVVDTRGGLGGGYWRFDDERVSSLKDDEFFGNEEAVARAQKKRSQSASEKEDLLGRIRSKEAYMLIYTRRDCLGEDEGEENAGGDDVPEDLAEAVRACNQELEGSYKAEKAVFDEDVANRREAELAKDRLFQSLPCLDGEVGFFMRTEWLKHWVSLDPVNDKCDKLDNRPLLSKYSLPDPSKVGEIKHVSARAWETLKEMYGAHEESIDLPANNLCLQSIRDFCRERKARGDLEAFAQLIRQAARVEPDISDSSAFWVSKQWFKDISACKEPPAALDPEGLESICSSDPSLSLELQEQCHLARLLTPDRSRRKLVCEEAAELIRSKFPNIPMFPANAEPCIICSAQMEEEAEKDKQLRIERQEMKRRVKAVYEEQAISLKSGSTYFLVDAEWVDKLKLFIQSTKIADLGPVDNSRLLVPAPDQPDPLSPPEGPDEPACRRWRLCYDPLDIRHQQPPFIWIQPAEWEYLLSKFGGGPPIRVTPIIPDDADGCIGAVVNRGSQFKGHSCTVRLQGHCSPPVCPNAVQLREAEELQSRLKYESGTVTIQRHSGPIGSIANNTITTARRLRTRKGDTEINVDSADTLRALKAKIYTALFISPTDQTLFNSGKELLNLDATLEELEIPNGAVLLLRVANADDEQGKGVEDREMGFAGSILAGWDPNHLAKALPSAVVVDVEAPSKSPPKAEAPPNRPAKTAKVMGGSGRKRKIPDEELGGVAGSDSRVCHEVIHVEDELDVMILAAESKVYQAR